MITDEDYEKALEEEDDPVWAEVEAMSDEEVTLSNARAGLSPEDTRRALEKVMAKFKAEVAQLRADWDAIDAMINEGAPPRGDEA